MDGVYPNFHLRASNRSSLAARCKGKDFIRPQTLILDPGARGMVKGNTENDMARFGEISAYTLARARHLQ